MCRGLEMPAIVNSAQDKIHMSEVLSAHWQAFLFVFAVGFGVSFLLTPQTIRLGKHLGIVAKPGGRRHHQQETSKLGGLALEVAFLAAVIVAIFMDVPRPDTNEKIRLVGLILGSIFISAIGFLDDRYELAPLPQYTAQLIAGAIAVLFLIFIESFNNPLTGSQTSWDYAFTVTITLFWFGFMMNTVNWLDGLDGLAAGVICIASLMIFIHAGFQLKQISVSLLALALCGATLGFLPFNFSPARVFMGSGALFLGYAIGALSIIGGAKMATILLVMGLPLFDTTWQIFRRMMEGKNPLFGDRGHLHFRLADMGYSQRAIVISYYIFCGFFGMMALVTTSQFFKLVSIVVMILILIGTFALLSVYTHATTLTAEKFLDKPDYHE